MLQGHIHAHGCAGTERLAHHPRRIAHRCQPLGQRFQHDGARTYLAAAAYGNVTQDRRIAPDEHVVAYFGMAVAFFLPRGAQGDAVQEGAVLADHGCFSDDHSCSVVNH